MMKYATGGSLLQHVNDKRLVSRCIVGLAVCMAIVMFLSVNI